RWGSHTRCEQAWKGFESVIRQLAQKREMLDAFRNAYWQEFLRVVEVLERFGAVQDAKLLARGRRVAGLGARPKLLAKGQLIAGLRHDNELLVAEVVDRGILADTTLAEAAALCSGLIEESRSGDAAVARLFLKTRPKLKRKPP